MEKHAKHELVKTFNAKKRNVRKLSRELDEFGAKKEKWHQIKSKLGQKISFLIKELKQAKKIRDYCTSKVKNNKIERDKVNVLIKQKVSNIKKLNTEKRETLQKHNIKNNPSQLKIQIEKLELKLETEAMGFSKEKQLMKFIKNLKKQYNEVKKLSDVWEKLHILSQEVDKLKSQSNSIHKNIQDKAKQSQTKHENLIATSNEIKELNQQEKDAFEKFIGAKIKFTSVNQELQKELIELSKFKEKLGDITIEKTNKKLIINQNRSRKIEHSIEEKFKSGQKLTNEDLLILQQSLN